MLHQPTSDSKPKCLLPGFVEIAQTLRQEESMESTLLPLITGTPSKEAIDPYKVMGMAMMATRLLQYQTTREVLVDIQVCSKGIMGLGLHPVVGNWPSLTLQELSDSDS